MSSDRHCFAARVPRAGRVVKILGNRAQDWLAQARYDLQHARNSLEVGDYEWACFAAHQAAEKSVKALILHRGGEGWGHSITHLLMDLGALLDIPEGVLAASRRLDKHYIPARYPNGFDRGIPREYYTSDEAREAINDAKTIYDFCRNSIS